MNLVIYTMFDKLCQNGNVVLNINQTNKMNENGLLIALESTNTVLNFGEKSPSPATGNARGGLRFNVSESDHLRVIELFNGSRFNVDKCHEVIFSLIDCGDKTFDNYFRKNIY